MTQENARKAILCAPADEDVQLKKRARRRLIGAVALALFAAIVLPMVMDHQPAPPLKDIQVRIPSPDEGATQKLQTPTTRVDKTEIKPIAKAKPGPEQQTEAKPEIGLDRKLEAKPETPSEKKPEPTPKFTPETKPASSGSEAWEVRLGAYAEPGRVMNLLAKLKELGLPTYTEKIETPNGPRTRVRAGPFPNQEAAEKARARIKIIGVDGPVAAMPPQ